jgi:hypothetical protein
MDTDVPPLIDPEEGEMLVTTGPAGPPTVALSKAPTVSELPDGDWIAVGDTADDTLVS